MIDYIVNHLELAACLNLFSIWHVHGQLNLSAGRVSSIEFGEETRPIWMSRPETDPFWAHHLIT